MTDTDKKIAKLTELLQKSKYTVFFGGAGVSTESGIPDFRSETGLYKAKTVYGYAPEELLSRQFFDRDRELFFRYYRENLIARDAKPNTAHFALAKLERLGLLKEIITQNIDGLHQAAGSTAVLELHGSNWRQFCVGCGAKYTLDYVLDHDNCKEGVLPLCENCGEIVRPDVVLYGEALSDDVVGASISAISSAELLVVGGSSLVVYPAAGLIKYFRGENLVLINKSKTGFDRSAQLVIHDSIGFVLGKAVESIQENEHG